MSVLKKVVTAAVVAAPLLMGAVAANAQDRDPGCSGGSCVPDDTGGNRPGCNSPQGCPGTNVNQTVKNLFTMVSAHAAAAAVGNGCTAVTGVNVGAGFQGFGATVSFSGVDKKFFVQCTHYDQLKTIFQSNSCPAQQLAILGMATTAGDMQGNPALQAVLNSQQGQALYAGMCQSGLRVERIYAPRPKG